MTFAAVLCCVMTATVFTACGDDETGYPATYKYDVVVAEALSVQMLPIMKCSRILKTQR